MRALCVLLAVLAGTQGRLLHGRDDTQKVLTAAGGSESPIAAGPAAEPKTPGELNFSGSFRGDSGFPLRVNPDSDFGAATCGIGDVNRDGIPDVAIGAPTLTIGGTTRAGGLYVAFMTRDAEVESAALVSPEDLDARRANGFFGSSCAGLGDLNEDGVPDVAVGMPERGDNNARGKVLIAFLDKDGSVHAGYTVRPGSRGFPTSRVPKGSQFGASVTPLGRFFEGDAKDGISDVAVGAPGQDGRGAVHLLALHTTGYVRAHTVIKAGSSRFCTPPKDSFFGMSVASLGDLNGDGVVDLAVGAPGEGEAGTVYVIRLNRDGQVGAFSRVSKGTERFDVPLPVGAMLGASLVGLGDIDGDGTPDLLVGLPTLANAAEQEGGGAGVVVRLSHGGGVQGAALVRAPAPGGKGARAFASVAVVERDTERDSMAVVVGVPSLQAPAGATGEPKTVGGVLLAQVTLPAVTGDESYNFTLPYARPPGRNRDCLLSEWSEWSECSVNCGVGFRWRQRAEEQEHEGNGLPCPSAHLEEHEACDLGPCSPASNNFFGALGSKSGSFPLRLGEGDEFGSAVCGLGDVDGDKNLDVAVGASGRDGRRGRLFVATLTDAYAVRRVTELGSVVGGVDVELGEDALYGSACAGLGDMDQDGVPDVAVGAPHDRRAHGRVLLHFLTQAGRARRTVSLGQGDEHIPAAFRTAADDKEGQGFGASVAFMGLPFKDEVHGVLAVGNPEYKGRRGAVFLVQLTREGRVHKTTVVAGGTHGLPEKLAPRTELGAGLASLGDVDGDGVGDLAVSAPGADNGHGVVYVLLLTAEGGVKAVAEVAPRRDGFGFEVPRNSDFAATVAAVGDVNGDDVPDLAVAAPRSNAGETNAGALYVVFLTREGRAKDAVVALPPRGRRRQQVGRAVGVIDFDMENRTLTLAQGAPRGRENGVAAGAVLLSQLTTEQATEDVGATLTPVFPALRLPRECVLSNWTAWSNCSEACGGGIERRARGVLLEADPGAKPCSEYRMEEKRECNTQPCPIDCVLSDWGSWSNCTAECGGGRQRRHRGVQVFPDYGGLECVGNRTEARDCNTQPCPIDCEVSEWGAWGNCSEQCGGGEQARNRSVVVPPAHGGGNCSALQQRRACNEQPCPIECEVGGWGEWSMCTAMCGNGTQYRERNVVQRPLYGAPECPPLREARECNTEPCPFDCVLSEWSAWGECSETCGNGTQDRSREVVKQPAYGGAPCGNLTETRACFEKPCPVHCMVGEWGEWGECSKACGKGGNQTRTREVLVPPVHGGDACPPVAESRDCFVKHCPVHCEVSDWTDWTACHPWCGAGTQNRTRTVQVEPDYGGDECPELLQQRNCSARPCPVECVVSEWEYTTECTARCDGGTRERERRVVVHPKHGGKACPGLEETVPCNTHECARPVLVTPECGFQSTGVECVASPNCGWAVSLERCLFGVVTGPTPLWTTPPLYMEDPEAEWFNLTGVTDWEFGYFKGAACHEYGSCHTCLADPLCGWCGATGECQPGDGGGPTHGALCPNDYMFAPRLRVDDPKLMEPGPGEIRLTQPRPSQEQLKKVCSMPPYERTALYRAIVHQGPVLRPPESCRPCRGNYPFCGCEHLLAADAMRAAAEQAAAAAEELQAQAEQAAVLARAHQAEQAIGLAHDDSYEAASMNEEEAERRRPIVDRADELETDAATSDETPFDAVKEEWEDVKREAKHVEEEAAAEAAEAARA